MAIFKVLGRDADRTDTNLIISQDERATNCTMTKKSMTIIIKRNSVLDYQLEGVVHIGQKIVIPDSP
ncbi:hypothetical protein ACTXT7_002076 [Hymenolepis weldensis]